MGTWSSTEPALPAGSSWSAYTANTTGSANHYKNTLAIRVARLAGRQVCIGVKFTQANGDYGDFDSSIKTVFTPRVGSTNETTTTLSASKSTRYRYYVTDADPGVTLRVTAAIQGGGVSIYRTITAPELLPTGLAVEVFTGGGWQAAEAAEIFSGGWNNLTSTAVFDGTWKEAT